MIGLFQGMFKKNIRTFNPGWENNAKKLASFTDVRDLQRQRKVLGVALTQEMEARSSSISTFERQRRGRADATSAAAGKGPGLQPHSPRSAKGSRRNRLACTVGGERNSALPCDWICPGGVIAKPRKFTPIRPSR